MIWFLFVPIVAWFAFKELVLDGYSDGFIEYFVNTIGCLLFVAMAALCSTGVAGLCGALFETYPAPVAEYELVALRDQNGVSGHFFLGTGTIEGEPYFFYYAKRDDGAFIPGKVNAGDVRVYEEDREDAKMTRFDWKPQKSWAVWIAIPWNGGGYEYEIRVPKGTIRAGYSI